MNVPRGARKALGDTGAASPLRGEAQHDIALVDVELATVDDQRAQKSDLLASLSTTTPLSKAIVELIRQRDERHANEERALRVRIDELQGQIAATRREIASLRAETGGGWSFLSAPSWSDLPHLENQGLFVVGHARSGTTVLARALNSCPDVFMLAEANIHSDKLGPGFARRYNEMHNSFRNPRSKASYCPQAPHDYANAAETFDWLSQRYRYVGEKLAFRSEALGSSPASFFDFHARHFYRAHYLCIVRNPIDVLKSSRDMFKPSNLVAYADSYMESLLMVMEMASTFPNVLVLFHEQIEPRTFEVAGERLGADLSQAFACYENRYLIDDLRGSDSAGLPMIDFLTEAHRLVRAAVSPKTLQLMPDTADRKSQSLMHDLYELSQEMATTGGISDFSFETNRAPP
jgi:hypothetical protein